jgi:hypothetical protein
MITLTLLCSGISNCSAGVEGIGIIPEQRILLGKEFFFTELCEAIDDRGTAHANLAAVQSLHITIASRRVPFAAKASPIPRWLVSKAKKRTGKNAPVLRHRKREMFDHLPLRTTHRLPHENQLHDLYFVFRRHAIEVDAAGEVGRVEFDVVEATSFC